MKTSDAAFEQAGQGGLSERRTDFYDKRAQLLDDADDALDGIFDVLGVFLNLLGLVVVNLDKVEVADDDAEKVVEIVRDALGDGADGGGAACFLKTTGEVHELAVNRDKTELRLHTGKRLIEVDGLRDVIHGADAEPLEFALFGRAGGDENNRNGPRVFLRLEALADLDAVHVGHHDIEQNEVGLFALDEVDGLKASIGGDDAQAFALKLALEELDVDRLVVDDQDFWCGHVGCERLDGKRGALQASAWSCPKFGGRP